MVDEKKEGMVKKEPPKSENNLPPMLSSDFNKTNVGGDNKSKNNLPPMIKIKLNDEGYGDLSSKPPMIPIKKSMDSENEGSENGDK